VTPEHRTTTAEALAGAAAVLAGGAALSGLLLPGLYRDAPFWAQQARGTDLATLLLAIPLLLGGLVATRRGSSAGGHAVLAGLLYLAYNYAIFAFSVAMNPLTVVYIAILGLTVWSLAVAAAAGNVRATDEVLHGRVRTASTVVLIVVGLLFGLLWLAQVAAFVATGAVPADLARAQLPTNPVYALDLGIFLPGCVAAGIALRTGRPRALAGLAIPLLLWLALTSAGIVGAFALQRAAGDDIPLPLMAFVATIGIVTAALPVIAAVDGRRPRKAPQGRLARRG